MVLVVSDDWRRRNDRPVRASWYRRRLMRVLGRTVVVSCPKIKNSMSVFLWTNTFMIDAGYRSVCCTVPEDQTLCERISVK